jgi:hypothetical protein
MKHSGVGKALNINTTSGGAVNINGLNIATLGSDVSTPININDRAGYIDTLQTTLATDRIYRHFTIADDNCPET